MLNRVTRFIALTYGSDADWVHNVLAADGCEIEARGPPGVGFRHAIRAMSVRVTRVRRARNGTA